MERSLKSHDDFQMDSPLFVILAGDADGNLGDCAILSGLVRIISDICPGARLATTSNGGLRERDLSSVAIIPKGIKGMVPLCRALSASNIVLIGGGGLFQDDDSLVKMPYWALRCVLARVFSRRIVGCSLGVGPLQSKVGQAAARLAFGLMAAVSVRDERAAVVARPLAGKSVEVTGDPALYCPAAAPESADEVLRSTGLELGDRKLIGVCPRRFFPVRRRVVPNLVRSKMPGYVAPVEASRELIRHYAKSLQSLISRFNVSFIFLPTYCADHEADDRISEEIMSSLPAGSADILRIKEPMLFAAVCRRLDVMIAGRMHAAIISASVGTESVGISYNQKFEGFFEATGQKDRLISVSEFLEDGGPELLTRSVSDAIDCQDDLSERVEFLQSRLRAWSSTHIGATCSA